MPISEDEKTRRRALLKAHYDAENDHNMDAIMKTFSPDCEMVYNRISFKNLEAINGGHLQIGFSNTEGAFEDMQNIIDAEHFTDDEIIIEGRLSAKHVREFSGIEAKGQKVELPFVAFYHYDETDTLISERVVMNLGALIA